MTTQLLTTSIDRDPETGDYAVRVNGDIAGHRSTYSTAEALRTEEITKRLPWNRQTPTTPPAGLYAPEAVSAAWRESKTALYWLLSVLTPAQLAQQAELHAAWLHERAGQAVSLDGVLNAFRTFIATFDPTHEQRRAA